MRINAYNKGRDRDVNSFFIYRGDKMKGDETKKRLKLWGIAGYVVLVVLVVFVAYGIFNDIENMRETHRPELLVFRTMVCSDKAVTVEVSKCGDNSTAGGCANPEPMTLISFPAGSKEAKTRHGLKPGKYAVEFKTESGNYHYKVFTMDYDNPEIIERFGCGEE